MVKLYIYIYIYIYRDKDPNYILGLGPWTLSENMR